MNDVSNHAQNEDRATSMSVYAGRRIALLTRHGKERAVAPVLDAALGCRVELVAGFDTDQLGTFTRDVPRAGTQIETARQKARIGMQLAGLPLGLASEGSFGPDPLIGLSSWNFEMLVFLDEENRLEIVGQAQGATNFAHLLTGDWGAASVFAQRAGFPDHHLIARPEGESDARIRKGIDSWTEFEAGFATARKLATNSLVFVETDMRAHANPTRMGMIRQAAEHLVKKIRSRCPACDLPGFWIIERVAGLPCADCGAPTNEFRADVHGCLKCAHREHRERAGPRFADPAHCPFCNP